MSDFTSSLGGYITAFTDYREALGYSRKTHYAALKSFDTYLAANFFGEDTLPKEAALGWLEEQHSGVKQKATAVRLLGKYMHAIGKEAYVLYDQYIRDHHNPSAYVFTDGELSALFEAIDKIKPTDKEPFLPETAPVMFRLIYTCGLRPNEGRELKTENVNLKTGEVFIVNTKRKKDRKVVMSGDMLSMCRSYNERREIIAHGNEYFFPAWEGGAYSNNQLGVYFRECWARANPNIEAHELPRVRVYDLRHRFASACLNRRLDAGVPLGTKLTYLRAYMGHDSLSETAYYIHILPENLVRSAGIDWDAFDEIIPAGIDWDAFDEIIPEVIAWDE